MSLFIWFLFLKLWDNAYIKLVFYKGVMPKVSVEVRIRFVEDVREMLAYYMNLRVVPSRETVRSKVGSLRSDYGSLLKDTAEGSYRDALLDQGYQEGEKLEDKMVLLDEVRRIQGFYGTTPKSARKNGVARDAWKKTRVRVIEDLKRRYEEHVDGSPEGVYLQDMVREYKGESLRVREPLLRDLAGYDLRLEEVIEKADLDARAKINLRDALRETKFVYVGEVVTLGEEVLLTKLQSLNRWKGNVEALRRVLSQVDARFRIGMRLGWRYVRPEER